MAHAFRLTPGVDYVKLPSAFKKGQNHYASRNLPMKFPDLLRWREELILATASCYRPDLFFVDNVPLGMKGEIEITLKHIRSCLPDSRIFLILRDILDDSESIVPEWQKDGIFSVLDRYYDHIFVCGSPAVFDPLVEYDFPEIIRRKTSFCGYICREFDRNRAQTLRRQLCPQGEKLIVVTTGGGSDGSLLVSNYLKALPLVHWNIPVSSVVLLGPEMDMNTAHSLAIPHRRYGPITFMDFSREAVEYLAAADLVVSMGGYNTVSEILCLKKKAIVVPRSHPRREQLIRGERLHRLGLLEMIRPHELTPAVLTAAIIGALERPQLPDFPLEFHAIQKISSKLKNMMNGNGFSGRPQTEFRQ